MESYAFQGARPPALVIVVVVAFGVCAAVRVPLEIFEIVGGSNRFRLTRDPRRIRHPVQASSEKLLKYIEAEMTQAS